MMGVSNSQMTANESGLLPTLCHTAAYRSIYFYTMLSKIHRIRTCVAYVFIYTAIKNQHSVHLLQVLLRRITARGNKHL